MRTQKTCDFQIIYPNLKDIFDTIVKKRLKFTSTKCSLSLLNAECKWRFRWTSIRARSHPHPGLWKKEEYFRREFNVLGLKHIFSNMNCSLHRSKAKGQCVMSEFQLKKKSNLQLQSIHQTMKEIVSSLFSFLLHIINKHQK